MGKGYRYQVFLLLKPVAFPYEVAHLFENRHKASGAVGTYEDDWDFGTGAGFYLDATVEFFSRHYIMDTYVTRELPRGVAEHFPASDVRGIFGHSMGGYGALTLSLKTPDLYASVSAFAPVSAPMRAPCGKKAFPGYQGADEELWREHDASELVRQRPFAYGRTILVDQGIADLFFWRSNSTRRSWKWPAGKRDSR